MEVRPFPALLLCVLATTLLTPSLGEVVAPRKFLGASSENVIRGETTPEGRYPYACTIHRGDRHDCTGFLIHPKIIITAAHCHVFGADYSFYCGGWKHKVDDDDADGDGDADAGDADAGDADAGDADGGDGDADAGDAGDADADDADDGGGDAGQEYTASSFVAHACFSMAARSLVNDVAVITIDEESDITLPIVSRDVHQIERGRSACVMGWGRTSLPYGPPSDELKIVKDLEETVLECPYGIESICVRSPTGRTAPGDSGGPVIIEGDSADKDIVFGLNSGSTTLSFKTKAITNLPFYLNRFVSEKVRAAENIIEASLPDPECPANPTENPSDNIQIEIGDASITFTCQDNAEDEEASVEWSEITRDGAEVRFDIEIEDFIKGTSGDSGFKLTVYEDTTLHIHGNGKSAEWISGGSIIAKSLILPGTGIHKARIEHTATG